MSVDLESLFRSIDLREQPLYLKNLVDKEIKAMNKYQIIVIFNRLLRDDVSPQVAKASTLHIASSLNALGEEVFEELGLQFLDAIKSFPNIYDETDYVLRDGLFNIYVSWGQCASAAQVLSAVNLSSTSRPFADPEKVDIYIKCAEAFLEEEAAVDAESLLNKASPFINNISDWTLLLRYRVTYARVLDANRKFIEAALRYYELSSTDNTKIVAEELLELLGKAVTCAILGKSGPQRARILALLSNDSRLNSLDHIDGYSNHATLLTKMFKGYIVKKSDLGAFEESLQQHQKSTTPEGYTLLEKAVIEHNMLATSNVYLNIRISDLSEILLIDEHRAEKVAATMIGENRLKAYIDQVEGFIVFEQSNSSLVQKFDEEIRNICHEVNNFLEILESEDM